MMKIMIGLNILQVKFKIFSHNFAKIKVDSYDSSPLEKTIINIYVIKAML